MQMWLWPIVVPMEDPELWIPVDLKQLRRWTENFARLTTSSGSGNVGKLLVVGSAVTLHTCVK